MIQKNFGPDRFGSKDIFGSKSFAKRRFRQKKCHQILSKKKLGIKNHNRILSKKKDLGIEIIVSKELDKKLRQKDFWFPQT